MIKHDMSLMPMVFSAIQKKMMEQHQIIMDKYHISRTHMPYLMMLRHESEGMTQHDMTEKSFLDKAHTSRALKELIDLGYVKKDDLSKYKNKYYLTDKGKKVAEAFVVSSNKIKENIMNTLTTEEVEQLTSIMRKLHQAIDMN